MPQAQHGLHQAREPSGLRRVADVALDRAKPAGERIGRAVAEGGAEGGDLDRIAQGRACAVGLDIGQGGGVDAGLGVDGAQQGGLGVGVRGGDAVAAAVLVGAGGLDDRIDPIAIRQRLGQRLQHDRGDGLPHHDPVGGGVERVAAAVRRKHAGAGHRHERLLVQEQADAADQGHPDLAPQQRLACQVERHERGRTGGVHDQSGASEIEEVADA